MADGRAVGVVLIGEDHVGPLTSTGVAASLPHFEPAERDALMRHYLGSMTWREVCAVLGVNFAGLPNTAAQASGVSAQNRGLPDDSV
jgi:hypothetical protein